MEKIYLSDSGPKVSPAIYGFWRWEDTSATGVKAMEKMVNLCLELGINTFDHADVYGGYQCEELFGTVLKQKSFRREDIVIFTKCGVCVPHNNRPEIRVKYIDSSADHIAKSVDSSLKKLGTDYIDIFLLDQLDPLSNLEEAALTLERLRGSGKIRNIGVANFSVFQHQLLASYLRVPIVTNHFELNLLNTTALDNGQLDYIKQRYMRPLAAAPLAGGRIENGTDEIALRVHYKLGELSKKYNAHIESIAVAWLVKLGALPLIGTISEQRIKNIVNAFDVDLDKQDWYDLYYASKTKLVTIDQE
ncbi:MAG TPA: aldo/keto reductase [Chitinophagaceae bacterium]|nr:aldo/keto reductase [Chitinophagaceae bacterium]